MKDRELTTIGRCTIKVGEGVLMNEYILFIENGDNMDYVLPIDEDTYYDLLQYRLHVQRAENNDETR